MIYFIPIEIMEQRYTKMMYDIISERVDVIIYPQGFGNVRIENGEFLDINKTCIFKAKQLQMVAELFEQKKIKDGDIFFVADIFFFGLESIRYMSELQGIEIKIVAFNHAGRADKYDFVRKLSGWADYSEQGYHEACDKILVGSAFHKRNVKEYFNLDENKVVVTGQVWDNSYCEKIHKKGTVKKEDFIIFPHRVSFEKGIDWLIQFAKTTDKKIFITTNGNKVDIELPSNVSYLNFGTKEEYYRMLDMARWYISTARQETFGYTLREAIYYGCNIIVPNYLSYVENTPKWCRYDGLLEINGMLEMDLVIKEDSEYYEKHSGNIDLIMNEVLN